jgi:hypothetical protein
MAGRNDERAPRHRIFAQSRAFPRGANLPILASTPKRNGDASVPGERSARRRGVLLVLVATVLWSMAGPFARLLAHLDIWTVMGWRALLGAVSIAVVGLI